MHGAARRPRAFRILRNGPFILAMVLALALLSGPAARAAPPTVPACSSMSEPQWLQRVRKSVEIPLLEAYIACFPTEDGARETRERLKDLVRDEACRTALSSSDIQILQNYLNTYPDSDCAKRVLDRMSELLSRRKYIALPNNLISGDQISRNPADTADACGQRCDKTAACMAYSFERSSRGCSLWSSARSRSPRGDVDSWSLQDVPLPAPPPAPSPAPAPAPPPDPAPAPPLPPPPAQPLFRSFPGVEIQGGDIASYNADRRQCEAQCTGNPRCAGYNHYGAQRVCVLKSNLQGVKTRPDVVSAVRNARAQAPPPAQTPAPAEGPRIRGVMARLELDNDGIPGSDYKFIRDVALESCIALCNSEPICRAFSYYENFANCVLKSAVGRGVEQSDVTSGVKR